MARFLTGIRIDRGAEITRLSQGNSLAHVEANGWKGGIRCIFSRKADDPDCDEFHVFASRGSDNPHGDCLIARLVVSPSGERTLTLYSGLDEIEEIRL